MFNVHFLYPFRGIELSLPPGSAPRDYFKPIHIPDNSLKEICIYREDVLYAQLNAESEEGRFSYVETPHDFFLGFAFKKPTGLFKVESLCRAPCCPPLYVRHDEVVRSGPIAWVYRHRTGITSRLIFDERRPELWET